MNTITPFIWFINNAEEAVKYYTSIFKKSKTGIIRKYTEASANASGMKKGSTMTIDFQLEGQHFVAINGGPNFAAFSPAISFFVSCATKDEVKNLYQQLSNGGSERMPLGEYPWSDCYGWCQDKFGVDWQIMLHKNKQKITPCLLFVGEKMGKAKEAIELYTKTFKGSKIIEVSKYGKGEPAPEGAIKHARIALGDYQFVLMDGPGKHAFDFTGAISFIVKCKTQAEIDHYWKALTKGGQELPCGWLSDKFGVVWQIDPENIEELLEKSQKAWQALCVMKKIDIKKLEAAAK